MTVPATTRRAGPFLGTGSITALPFTFKVFEATDLVVTRLAGGVESVLVLATDYTVSLNLDQDAAPGGTVTPTSAPLVTETLTITSGLEYEQTLDLLGGGKFSPSSIEDAFDRTVIQIQQLVEENERALRAPVSFTGDAVLPAPQANRLIGWNEDENALQNVDPQALATIVAYGTANADLFSGDGVQTQFDLTDNPGNLNNLDISIGGVTQTPVLDYSWSGGVQVTFTSPPPAGASNILVRYMQGLPQSGAALPNQTGNSGKLLVTDGSNPSWVDVQSAYLTVPRTGAVRRTMQGRLFDGGVNVLDFIPESEHAAIRENASAYDCRLGIQAAIDSLGLRGGRVFFPRGTYEVSKNPLEQACIRIVCPIVMEGEGYFSVIKPKSDVGVLTNTITYTPSPLVDCSQSCIRQLFLGDPNTGTRAGNAGVFLDTQASDSYLPELVIHDMFIGLGNGPAIYHLHDPNRATAPANGVTGGLYSATFRSNQLRGGIRLENSGDSINIWSNIISGSGVGIYASIINGASQLNIQDNNITSTGGAICLDSARRVQIIGNNIEQTTTMGGANDASMISLRGTNGPVVNCTIRGNNMGAFTGTGVAYNILLQNAIGANIYENSFLPASNTAYGIAVFVGASQTRIGWNQYGSGSLLRVFDGGVGTIGVAKSYSGLLQNGWVPFLSNFADCYYIKDADGYVTIAGAIRSGTMGTVTAPVILFQLPADYRPAKSEHFVCYSQNSVPAVVQASILVNAALGNVVMLSGANDLLSFNIRFMAASPALSDVAVNGHSPGFVSDL